MPTPNARHNRPLKVLERDVTRTCREYLELRHWRAVRINAGPFGKAGMPDFLMLRYRRSAPGQVEAAWLELKSERGRLGPLQKQWIEEERAKGAVVWVVSDVSELIGLYEAMFGREGQMRLIDQAPAKANEIDVDGDW
jgi:hypothetical protein